jgi:hypothetical protein
MIWLDQEEEYTVGVTYGRSSAPVVGLSRKLIFDVTEAYG